MNTVWKSIIVVPCYNEASRLPASAFEEFARTNRGTRLLFVDDGSTDDTESVLREIERAGEGQIAVIRLDRNQGKAEAVREGLIAAFSEAPRYAGFWDADLSTPLDAISDFEAVLDERPGVLLVMGARVRLLGRRIQRSPLRHYAGRVFATAASFALRLAVYDTQCGAKLFRVTSDVRHAFEEPFISRWAFDVEIIARLLQRRRQLGAGEAAASIYELPLSQWLDVPGSKVRIRDFPRSIFALLRIYLRYRR